MRRAAAADVTLPPHDRIARSITSASISDHFRTCPSGSITGTVRAHRKGFGSFMTVASGGSSLPGCRPSSARCPKCGWIAMRIARTVPRCRGLRARPCEGARAAIPRPCASVARWTSEANRRPILLATLRRLGWQIRYVTVRKGTLLIWTLRCVWSARFVCAWLGMATHPSLKHFLDATCA